MQKKNILIHNYLMITKSHDLITPSPISNYTTVWKDTSVRITCLIFLILVTILEILHFKLFHKTQLYRKSMTAIQQHSKHCIENKQKNFLIPLSFLVCMFLHITCPILSFLLCFLSYPHIKKRVMKMQS
jgi:hypothetical protein